MGELKKIKTAVVGCGSISNIYCKNLKNMYHIIDLTAVCDIFRESAERKATQFGIEKVMSMEELCADQEIELVINLTGPAQHFSVTSQLLGAGKHVYSEKPLAPTFEEAEELARLADEMGVYLGCAPDTFLGACFQTAIHYMDKGMIGKVLSFSISAARNLLLFSETMRMIRNTGGSMPFDQEPYYLNALIAMFGPIEKVTGVSRESGTYEGRVFGAGNYGETWDLSGSNLQAAVLVFKSGVIGTILLDGNATKDGEATFVINGSDGLLKLGAADHFSGTVTLVQNGQSVILPETHGFNGKVLYGDPLPDWDWGEDRGAGAAEMAYSILKGRKNRASKEMAVHVVEVIHGIDQSSRTGEVYVMTTTCERPRPLPAGYTAATDFGLTAEASLSL